jgi:hypothetical protein
VADLLLPRIPAGMLAMTDRGYEPNAVRHPIERTGPTPDIPPKVNP